jgi:hypothetical protein
MNFSASFLYFLKENISLGLQRLQIIVYICVQMEKWCLLELFQEWGRGKGEW